MLSALILIIPIFLAVSQMQVLTGFCSRMEKRPPPNAFRLFLLYIATTVSTTAWAEGLSSMALLLRI